MPIRLVVTDMDNTLYSWVDYIVPAVEAMVDSVTMTTEMPRLKVIQSLKAVYTHYESNEYPFALQESSIFKAFEEFSSFDKLVIEPARAAFSAARNKYLKPYKTVTDTLQVLSSQGIVLVALTDAPRNPAEQRVKKMQFDELFQALYTMPGFEFPVAPSSEQVLVAPEIATKHARGDYRAKCDVVELPKAFEKPNPQGLLRIFERFGVKPHEAVFVGDSLMKDVALAQAVGCVDVWAEYGTYVSLDYRERLNIISSNAITRRHAASVLEVGKQSVTPTHSLSNFGQLVDIVNKHR